MRWFGRCRYPPIAARSMRSIRSRHLNLPRIS
jgi:hypothetical protein